MSDNFQMHGKKPEIKVLSFEVIRPTEELQRDLFLMPHDFVYKIVRLRLFEGAPFMIETGYIPIKIVQKSRPDDYRRVDFFSLSGGVAQSGGDQILFLSIFFAEPSLPEDQELLHLKENEPVGIMEGIFFLDNGTPFEFSHMRFHYEYLKFNTFVSVH
ncbi:UTRA domain-containing protein [Paenibacillus rhizoplanae]